MLEKRKCRWLRGRGRKWANCWKTETLLTEEEHIFSKRKECANASNTGEWVKQNLVSRFCLSPDFSCHQIFPLARFVQLFTRCFLSPDFSSFSPDFWQALTSCSECGEDCKNHQTLIEHWRVNNTTLPLKVKHNRSKSSPEQPPQFGNWIQMSSEASLSFCHQSLPGNFVRQDGSLIVCSGDEEPRAKTPFWSRTYWKMRAMLEIFPQHTHQVISAF